MRLHGCLLSAGLLIFSTSPLLAGSPSGNWLTYGSKGMVRISQCGGGLCGKIVWLRQAVDSKGRPVRDVRNRNPSLRGRQVMGLTTFSGLKPVAPNKWSGVLYNPDDGRTYRGTMTLIGVNSLRIKACRVGGGACGQRTWMRAQQRAQN